MDVVAEVDGLRVVLEAEPGFHRKAQAIKGRRRLSPSKVDNNGLRRLRGRQGGQHGERLAPPA